MNDSDIQIEILARLRVITKLTADLEEIDGIENDVQSEVHKIRFERRQFEVNESYSENMRGPG